VTKVGESEKRSLSKLCLLLGYTRQAYYGQTGAIEREALGAELIVGEAARIRERQKRLGVRKLYHLMEGFMAGHGIGIGRDAFFGLMREHCMLVRKRRGRVPRTTFSAFWLRHYPNLTKGFTADRANRLWVSDITYVRIGEGFGYLSLVTDAYSRKIVGYALSRSLTSRGPCLALKSALDGNRQREGLIHHSDRGRQYYSRRYLKLLLEGGARVSMSEKSDPLENAIAERVNGILKQELLRGRFENFEEAEKAVDEAVGTYNHLRPHLSIDMLTPAEAHEHKGQLKRRWKTYRRQKNTALAQAMA
jgi:putative transposase